ncbi:unnamed protein product [Clonostachys rhizophaga]|uniref:JmjC domain-containing protein n=1 Tax=Clonostachys rhizophaga TaxID=160324 RepID=A0A9N9VE70_9HYPO|nr:unnamed protein product [Clonostachys rhizophaga]
MRHLTSCRSQYMKRLSHSINNGKCPLCREPGDELHLTSCRAKYKETLSVVQREIECRSHLTKSRKTQATSFDSYGLAVENTLSVLGSSIHDRAREETATFEIEEHGSRESGRAAATTPPIYHNSTVDGIFTTLKEKYQRGPLAAYLSAFLHEIKRARSSENGNYWSDATTPSIISGTQCWHFEGDDDKLLNNMLDKWKQIPANVYSSWDSKNPTENLAKVLNQLSQPDPDNPHYAINMGDCDAIRLPPQYALYATEDRLATTSNLTPQHAIVELHIDRGFHGLTVLRRGCVKFWMFYPATDRNMSLWDQYCGKPYPFLSLVGQLEGPVFEVQKHGEAIHFGPCFHITYTLEGGITSGVNYMRAESFKITYRILEIEQNHNRPKSNDFKALLECVSLCLRDIESRSYKEALGACFQYVK